MNKKAPKATITKPPKVKPSINPKLDPGKGLGSSTVSIVLILNFKGSLWATPLWLNLNNILHPSAHPNS